MVQNRRASRDYCDEVLVQPRRSSKDYNNPGIHRSNSAQLASESSAAQNRPHWLRPQASRMSLTSGKSELRRTINEHGVRGAARLVVHLNWNVLRPLIIASVPTAFAVAMKWYQINHPDTIPDGLFPEQEVSYTTLSWLLGIVMVFRTGQAYNRFWDGATNLMVMKTEFFDACAQISSFAESSDAGRSKIDAFQLTIVRLFSLLHATALQQVTEIEDEDIKVIDHSGLDSEQLRYMRSYSRRVRPDIVMQWITRTITEAVKVGVVDTPSPLVSRVLHECNQALIALAQMRAIADIPFPIPYHKMVGLLLICHIFMTPFYAVAFSNARVWAGIFAFVPVFSLWCIQYIGVELEQPFGHGVDDLDLSSAQADFNTSLLTLLQSQTQWSPDLDEVIASPKCVQMSLKNSAYHLEQSRVTHTSELGQLNENSPCGSISAPICRNGAVFTLDSCRVTGDDLDKVGRLNSKESLQSEQASNDSRSEPNSPSSWLQSFPGSHDKDKVNGRTRSLGTRQMNEVMDMRSNMETRLHAKSRSNTSIREASLKKTGTSSTSKTWREDLDADVKPRAEPRVHSKEKAELRLGTSKSWREDLDADEKLRAAERPRSKEVPEWREGTGMPWREGFDAGDKLRAEERKHSGVRFKDAVHSNSAMKLDGDSSSSTFCPTTSNNCVCTVRKDKLDQILQSNNHCLALFKTLADAAVHDPEAGSENPCSAQLPDSLPMPTFSTMPLNNHVKTVDCLDSL